MMAQTEDTELRDLVIEALDKNGSLAKIRALLRANVFLAFEDECANLKHNPTLDNVLRLPEGLLALSIVHEFLEFCNLKNTLFVYTAESRQGKDYHYEGKKLCERLSLPRKETMKEPILISLLKQHSKSHKKQDLIHFDNLKGCGDKNCKDEQNCTYIVHEDSSGSTTSNSQSDSSSDEKNKRHLRLNLDHSDTDTSSDSARDKSCSEYIPNQHLLNTEEKTLSPPKHINQRLSYQNSCLYGTDRMIHSPYLQELKLVNQSSSDSTSYVELKSFNRLEKKLINTTGVPFVETEDKSPLSRNGSNDTIRPLSKLLSKSQQQNEDQTDSATSAVTLSVSLSKKQIYTDNNKSKSQPADVGKSEETEEYSYNFTSPRSPPSTRNSGENETPSESIQEVNVQSLNKSHESQHHNTHSPHSSVSISDVADLISEKSYSEPPNNNEDGMSDSKNQNEIQQQPDDSGNISDSPVPSISNLSLDIHSD